MTDAAALIEEARAEHTPLRVGGGAVCLACGMARYPCAPARLADALAEAQQRVEAVKAIHKMRGVHDGGMPAYYCGYCNSDRWPCSTIAALSSSTAPEAGIGARQWGVNAVSDPEMGSTAPETPAKPVERCYHPFSNPAPGGRTMCRSCGVDTTHDDKMGG